MSDAQTTSAAAPAPPPRGLPLPPVDSPERHPETLAPPCHTLLIRTAKLVAPGGEALCVLRDASSERVRIKTFAPLPPERELELEMPVGQRHRVVRMWEDGDQAEFRFVHPADLVRLVAQVPPHLRKREISLNCMVPGVVSARSGECDVKLLDISQHAAKIECGLHLALNERVRLETESLPPLMTTIEWRRAPFYRVLFDRPFAFDELARLCGVIAAPPPSPGAAASSPPAA